MHYFDDLSVGDEAVFDETHCVSEQDIIEMGKRWDPQPFHVDPVAAKDSMFGGLVASSTHVFCICCSFGKKDMDRDKLIAAVSALGFDKHNLLIARLSLPERPYELAEKRRQFAETVLERVRQVPAVSSAALVNALPYGGSNNAREFYPEGVTLTPAEVRYIDYRRASPEYLATMRIPILAGRGLADSDRADGPPRRPGRLLVALLLIALAAVAGWWLTRS